MLSVKSKKGLDYMDMILKTTDLCKNFKGQMAVNNVSLNIRRNSVYGLLGPNGAGKSTILKMLTGILRPTSGSIEFDGHPWKRNDLEHIGALIEMPPLYENLTAYENLKVRTTLLGLDDGFANGQQELSTTEEVNGKNMEKSTMEKLKIRFHHETNDLDYVPVGDYYLPDLTLDEQLSAHC